MKATDIAAVLLLGTFLFPVVDSARRFQIPIMSQPKPRPWTTRSDPLKHPDRDLFMGFDTEYHEKAFSMPPAPSEPSSQPSSSDSVDPSLATPTLLPSTTKHPNRPTIQNSPTSATSKHPAINPASGSPSRDDANVVPTSSPNLVYMPTLLDSRHPHHGSHPTESPNNDNSSPVLTPVLSSSVPAQFPTTGPHLVSPSTAAPESAMSPHDSSPIGSPTNSFPTRIPAPSSFGDPTRMETKIPSTFRPMGATPNVVSPVIGPSEVSSTPAPTSKVSGGPLETPTIADSPAVAPYSKRTPIPNAIPSPSDSPVASETGAPLPMPSTDKSSAPIYASSSSAPAPSTDNSERPTHDEFDTESPTHFETSQTDGSCHTVKGFYGSVDEPSTIATFGYELETTAASSENELTSQILPALEDSMSNYLLPHLFVECDQNNRKLLHPIYANNSPVPSHRSLKETLVGASSQPADLSIRDVSCRGSSATEADSVCWVIRGEMELFYNTSSRRFLSGGSDEDTIRRVLRKAMERGTFVGAHPSIVRVSYVDLSELETDQVGRDRDPVPTGATSGSTDDPSADSLTVHQALLIGFVAVAAAASLLLGLLLARRRRLGRLAGDPLAYQGSGDDTLQEDSLAEPTLPTIVVPSEAKASSAAAAGAATSPLTLEAAASADLDGFLTEAPSDASVYLEGSLEGGGTTAVSSPQRRTTMVAQGLMVVVDSLCPGAGVVDDDDHGSGEKGSAAPPLSSTRVATTNKPPRLSILGLRDPGSEDRAAPYYNLQSPTDDSVYMLESDGSRDAEARSLQN